MLTNSIQIFVLASGIAILLSVLRLIKNNRLDEKYSIIWLCVGFGLTAAAAFPGPIVALAAIFKLAPAAIIIVFIIIGVIVAGIHVSMVLTRLNKKCTILAQEVAMLHWQIEQKSEDQAIEPRGNKVEN